MSKNKRQDLQPWLDYFRMLQQYEAKGFLEIKPQEHEAYITRAALLTLAGIDVENVQSAAISSQPEALADTLRNIRAYAVWLEAALPTPAPPLKGAGSEDISATETAAANSQLSARPLVARKARTLNSQLNTPFATHIVKEDYPHDLLLTLLLQQKRSWRTAWRTVDTIEAIDYTEQKPQEK